MPRRLGSGHLRPPTDTADAAVRAELIERAVRLRVEVRELIAIGGPDEDLSEALLTRKIDGSVTSRASRPTYFIGRDGTLYRQRGVQMDLFSVWSTGDWCPVQVPTRYPLRPISRVSAWMRLARARWTHLRFERATGAR